MTKEELTSLIESMKGKLDETTGALISEDLLAILGTITSLYDTINERDEKIAGLQKDNEDLLKVNGRLFQKIGFEKEPENEEKEDDIEDIKIEDIINEKGELI